MESNRILLKLAIAAGYALLLFLAVYQTSEFIEAWKFTNSITGAWGRGVLVIAWLYWMFVCVAGAVALTWILRKYIID